LALKDIETKQNCHNTSTSNIFSLTVEALIYRHETLLFIYNICITTDRLWVGGIVVTFVLLQRSHVLF